MPKHAQARAAPLEPCFYHTPSDLGYIERADQAERLAAEGQEQRFCKDCRRWFWPHEWGTEP